MTEISFTVFSLGAALTDTLEAWVLALMGLVLGIDLVLGIRRKAFLHLGFIQAFGLTGSYLWASWMAQQQDISGPYAWSLVVGLWFILAAVFHLGLVAIRLTAMRQRP
ncbi:hypothetical protein [Pseudophaeobacter sp. EL27]|uniref:hypothetical protein n=1 Tax=Pseudophaeobacter sp. EL27 TaxID=2107580 RepID=UPI000EFAD846|nr:hypothetical protein [Pseudophaeobacter sp. EL27]